MNQATRRPTKPYRAHGFTVGRVPQGPWTTLKPGERVIVRDGKLPPFEAQVELLTYDRTVVWIQPLSSGGRRAFHHADDVTISPVEAQEAPARSSRSWR